MFRGGQGTRTGKARYEGRNTRRMQPRSNAAGPGWIGAKRGETLTEALGHQTGTVWQWAFSSPGPPAPP